MLLEADVCFFLGDVFTNFSDFQLAIHFAKVSTTHLMPDMEEESSLLPTKQQLSNWAKIC